MRASFVAAAGRLLDARDSVAIVLAESSADMFVDAQQRHPDRVINVGIREQLLISVAGGMALTGMRPIVHAYASFLLARPFEQIKLDLGHQGVGAVLVSIGASYDTSEGGRTHQAPEDVALLDTQEAWTVHVPGHPAEVEPLLRSAVSRGDRTYLRLSSRTNSAPRPVHPSGLEPIRQGSRGTVVAVGPMLDRTLAATTGLDVTVLYATTIRPFDTSTLRSTLVQPDVVLVEPYLAGTSTHAIAEALTDVPHRTLTLGVGPAETRAYGTPDDHDRLHGLDATSIRYRLEAFLAPR